MLLSTEEKYLNRTQQNIASSRETKGCRFVNNKMFLKDKIYSVPTYVVAIIRDKLEDNKRVIRSRKSKKGRHYNDQKERGQKNKFTLSTKHYTEN